MHIELGMNAIANVLFTHKYSRVKWDRSEKGLSLVSNLIKDFVDLEGNIIAMI